MTVWSDVTFGAEVYETRLKEAEQYRRIQKLPPREARSLLERVVAYLGGKVGYQPVTLQEVKV